MLKNLNKEIYLCGTPYHILISLLFNSKNNKKIYFSCKSSDVLDNIKNMFFNNKNLEKLGFDEIIFRKRTTLREVFFIEKYIDWRHTKKYDIQNIISFGWHKDCYYFYSNYFCKKSKKVQLIEDGLTMYRHSMNTKMLMIKKKFGLITEPWNEKNVFEIQVQKPEKFPKEYQKKIKKLELKKLFDSLSKEKKEILCSIFFHKEIFLEEKKESILILTQPLSEDKIISKNIKLSLYKELVIKNKDKIILFKPHPRDLDSYREVLKDFNIYYIKKEIPIEAINLLDLKINQVISICSSGTFNLFNIKKRVELYPELMEEIQKYSKNEIEKKIIERVKNENCSSYSS